MPALRTSPLDTALSRLDAQWGRHAGMHTARGVRGELAETAATLGIADVSALLRTGLKGPRAADRLEHLGVPVPAAQNRWLPMSGGGIVARLGRAEFLVEDAWSPGVVASHAGALREAAAGVYPVLRQDCALAITGAAAPDLFAETCAVPFAADDPSMRIVTLTSMVGVGVTVLRRDVGDLPCWRLWCDGTFGPYLFETLTDIAAGFGGGPMGVRLLSGDLSATVVATQRGSP